MIGREKYIYNNNEKEILQKLIGLIYELQDDIDINLRQDKFFSKESCRNDLEDCEERDMDKFYGNYPYCKIIPYRIMLAVQREYNQREMCARWCGAYSPKILVDFLEDLKLGKYNIM